MTVTVAIATTTSMNNTTKVRVQRETFAGVLQTSASIVTSIMGASLLNALLDMQCRRAKHLVC